MTQVKFINHSSILIDDGETVVLTDPWYDKPAFGSWLPTPPPIFHPVYMLSLAESNKQNFILLISHGHDDHCDDNYLKLFPNGIRVVIPKFSSPGLRNRIARAGFNNVIEVDKQTRINNVNFNTFLHEEISHDDAIISIKTRDAYVVHANDNWRYTEQNISRMRSESGSLPTLLATQINIANGWPYLYEAYSKEEKIELANNRLIYIMNEVYKGAIEIGVDYFFHYAGHSTAYVKDNEEIKELGGFKPLDFYKKNINPNLFKKIKFLDILPGYSFDFETGEVSPPLGALTYHEQSLKHMSHKFYDYYKIYEKTDSYIHTAPIFSPEQRALLLRDYLAGFSDYVMGAIDRSGQYQKDIMDSVIEVADADGLSEMVKVGKGLVKATGDIEADTTFTLSPPMLDALLAKKIIWENLDIGFQALIRKKNTDYHNGHIIRWLSRYGYLYFNSK